MGNSVAAASMSAATTPGPRTATPHNHWHSLLTWPVYAINLIFPRASTATPKTMLRPCAPLHLNFGQPLLNDMTGTTAAVAGAAFKLLGAVVCVRDSVSGQQLNLVGGLWRQTIANV